MLEDLGAARAPQSVADVATRTGLHPTVVRRNLDSLSDADLVIQRGSLYTIGPRVLLLSRAYLDQLALHRAALPYLLELQSTALSDSPRSLVLAVPVGGWLTIVHCVFVPTTPLSTILDIGTTFPIVAASGGRAILAYQDSAPATTLPAGVDQSDLADRLDEIRDRDGIEFSAPPFDSVRSGIASISVAVRDSAGSAVASLTLFGTDLGAHLDPASDLCGHLRRAADGVSGALR